MEFIKKVQWLFKTFKNPISVFLFSKRKINKCTFKFRDDKINNIEFTKDFDFSFSILSYWDGRPFPKEFIEFINNLDVNNEFLEYEGLKFKADNSSWIFFESDDYFDKFEIKDRVLLDIGGNVADTALKFVNSGGGKVYAFEPMHSLFEIALENIDLNPQYKNKICFYNKAISGKKGKIIIYESESNSGGHSQYHDGGIEYSLDAITIDDAINCFNILPDILKMDCEGCEYNIILNSDLSIFNDIIFEYHSGIVNKPYSILVKKLMEEGFTVKVYNKSQKDEIGIIHAWKDWFNYVNFMLFLKIKWIIMDDKNVSFLVESNQRIKIVIFKSICDIRIVSVS